MFAASVSGFCVAKPNDVSVDTHEINAMQQLPYKLHNKLRRQLSMHQHNKSQYTNQHYQQQSQSHNFNKNPSNFDLIKQSSEPLHSTLITDSTASYSGTNRTQTQQQQNRKQSSTTNESSEVSTPTASKIYYYFL